MDLFAALLPFAVCTFGCVWVCSAATESKHFGLTGDVVVSRHNSSDAPPALHVSAPLLLQNHTTDVLSLLTLMESRLQRLEARLNASEALVAAQNATILELQNCLAVQNATFQSLQSLLNTQAQEIIAFKATSLGQDDTLRSLNSSLSSLGKVIAAAKRGDCMIRRQL